jgi:cytochrome c-type biogenesis protein CcmE
VTAPATDRRRLRGGIVLALVLGASAFMLVKVLDGATTYFLNADEAVAQREDLGTKRIRVQGTVVAGSVEAAGEDVAFDIEFHCVIVHVRHAGDPPELFKPGIPVVLEGAFAEGGDTYESDRILVKHTSEYRTDRLEQAEREACRP